MSDKIAEGCWKVLYSRSDRLYRIKKVGWSTFQADYIFLMRDGSIETGTFYAGPNFHWRKKRLTPITEKEYFLAVLRGRVISENG